MRSPVAACAALALLLSPAALFAGDDEAKEGGKPAPAKEAPKEQPAATPGSGSQREPDKSPGAPAAKQDPKAQPAKAPPPAVVARSPRSRAEALAMLDRIVLSVNFDETPLPDVVRWMAAVTGVNVIVGPALQRSGDADLLKVSLRLTKVTAKQVLDLVADSHRLGIGFQSGVLTVTTQKEARGKPVLRMYLLSDITFPLRDFPAPDLILRSQGDEKREPEAEEVVKPAFGEPEDILTLVKESVGDGTWEDEGVSASVMKEWLLVRQYEDVHAQIARILALLRASR